MLGDLIKYCKILRITVQLQPHRFDFPLKTRVANHLLTRLHIYKPTWTPRVMPKCVPAVRCSKARHSSMRSSLWSGGVSWGTLIGYPSHVRNRTCALPSPSLFHCAMAKIMPAMQLAVHAESGTFYGSPYSVKSNFFRLYGLLLFCITMGLGCRRCELHYKDDGKRQFSRKRSTVADTPVSLVQLKYILLDPNDLLSLWRERITPAHLPGTVFWPPCLVPLWLLKSSFLAALFLSVPRTPELSTPIFFNERRDT